MNDLNLAGNNALTCDADIPARSMVPPGLQYVRGRIAASPVREVGTAGVGANDGMIYVGGVNDVDVTGQIGAHGGRA